MNPVLGGKKLLYWKQDNETENTQSISYGEQQIWYINLRKEEMERLLV